MIKKLFLLLFIVIGLTTSAQTAQELVDKGVEYYEVGDYTNALKYFQQAAEQGNAKAQYNLGVCYENGQGVLQNYTEAVKWYRKAAEQGDALAQYNLGGCYYVGQGVAQNYTEAVKWIKKAAKQGDALAIEALKQLGEQ